MSSQVGGHLTPTSSSSNYHLKTRRAMQSRAVAYCRQPASTVTLGIELRWDPWPVSRHLFFSSFVVPPLIKREGLGFFIIGVPLLHLIPPEGTLIKTRNESESYVTTDGQSASLSWYKAPIRGLRPDFVSVRNTEYV
jgi:hypothetical protein